MNRQIRRLGIAVIVLYSLLFVQLNRIQVFGAQRLNDDVNNTRDILRDFGKAARRDHHRRRNLAGAVGADRRKQTHLPPRVSAVVPICRTSPDTSRPCSVPPASSSNTTTSSRDRR